MLPLPSSSPAALPNEAENTGNTLAVQLSAEVLLEAPTYVPPPSAAISLVSDVAVRDSLFDSLPNGVAREPVLEMLDPGPDWGVPASEGLGHSRGSRLGVELSASTGSGVQSIDRAHSPFLDEKMCFGDASDPNSAVDRLATIGCLTPMKAASFKELSCPDSAVAALEVVLPEDGSHDNNLPLPGDLSRFQAGFDALEVDPSSANPNFSKVFLLEEAGTIERPADEGNNFVGENRVMDIDSNGVSTQSSEGWSAEDFAKYPMHYVLQCLLLEKATQLYVCSIDKDQQASLFDFLDSCWNDVTEF
ncbi:hypothetical protein Nepgr_024747 [Nepenthes gracilis]|uniref:Uncharacterized protein n=1 Tax=Nepenthes gracilis TaxID=150966 RepID=A0AAD3Y0C1_NEPGR|nr:hypothetical protein Nepgr_024747 [Nepenthes gracilis]